MKSVLHYPGGKKRIASWIINHMSPYHSYLEPYFGGGAVHLLGGFFMKEKICLHDAEKSEHKYPHPKCFTPEENNPYPLCIGKELPECKDCQIRADWEPEDPYGVGD